MIVGNGSIKINEEFDITPHPFPSLSIITLKLKLLKDKGVLLISKVVLLDPLYIWLSLISYQSKPSTLDCHLNESTNSKSESKEIFQSKKDRAKLDGAYECILCDCCSPSCPS